MCILNISTTARGRLSTPTLLNAVLISLQTCRFRLPFNPTFFFMLPHSTVWPFSSSLTLVEVSSLEKFCFFQLLRTCMRWKARGEAGEQTANKQGQDIQMTTVFSRHIYQHPLIRTLELARYARFISSHTDSGVGCSRICSRFYAHLISLLHWSVLRLNIQTKVCDFLGAS